MAGGALSDAGVWIRPKTGFLFPVRALSEYFVASSSRVWRAANQRAMAGIGQDECRLAVLDRAACPRLGGPCQTTFGWPRGGAGHYGPLRAPGGDLE
ncbi:MAG: hypothetical protein IPN64_10970 [Propionivibrio sp.]|nr:hypothetical protein [Propionivibrio sp.]